MNRIMQILLGVLGEDIMIDYSDLNMSICKKEVGE